MTTVSQGIKSISTRLDNIEATLSVAPSFEPSFVAQIHQKESEVKKRSLNQKYQDVKDKYVDEIKKWIQDPLKEITKVIEVTVHYVETYSPIVGQIFGVVLKGDSKLSFALELIGMVVDIVNSFLDSDLLKNMINHFCLIMNERKSLTASTQSTESVPTKKKKKGFIQTIRGSLC